MELHGTGVYQHNMDFIVFMIGIETKNVKILSSGRSMTVNSRTNSSLTFKKVINKRSSKIICLILQ